MAANTLDRINRDNPGGDVRRYVARLFIAGGASREQVKHKLKERYGVSVNTRIITAWLNGDKKLIAFMEELEKVKNEMAPDTAPADVPAAVPEPIDNAQMLADLIEMALTHPAFGDLMHREAERAEAPNDDIAVLAAGHETDEEFEADCIRRLDGWEPPPQIPTPGAGSLP